MNKFVGKSCQNTYFNRKLGAYIETLIEAENTLSTLECSVKSFESGNTNYNEVLANSRKMDDIVLNIMRERGEISDVLSAKHTFGS